VALAETCRNERMIDEVLDRTSALTPENLEAAQAAFKAAKVRGSQLGIGRRGRSGR